MTRYSVTAQENPYMAKIRDGEIINPAPFGKRELLILPSIARDSRYHNMWEVEGDHERVITDVPVMQIAGLGQPGHLDNFVEGMCFRDALFLCLHGASLCADSLTYFVSDGIKAHSRRGQPGFVDYPQDNSVKGRKIQGTGGIAFEQRGDWFFVNQGQQRTIMAMFWIFQCAGERGLLKQVDVRRAPR